MYGNGWVLTKNNLLKRKINGKFIANKFPFNIFYSGHMIIDKNIEIIKKDILIKIFKNKYNMETMYFYIKFV